ADTRRLPEEIKDAIIVIDLDHEIARVKLSLANDSFAAPHLCDAFDRNDDLAELVVQPFDFHPSLDCLFDRFFAAALHFHHIPFLGTCAGRLRIARFPLTLTVWWRGSQRAQAPFAGTTRLNWRATGIAGCVLGARFAGLRPIGILAIDFPLFVCHEPSSPKRRRQVHAANRYQSSGFACWLPEVSGVCK